MSYVQLADYLEPVATGENVDLKEAQVVLDSGGVRNRLEPERGGRLYVHTDQKRQARQLLYDAFNHR